MINWYYVQGSERVGPVGEDVLRELFSKQELNPESYVWRKGFQNWERLKDVKELDFSSPKKVEVEKKEESSPEVTFNFDWSTIGNDEELFFIKIGTDRKIEVESDLFGPYSVMELQEALTDKRINYNTLIFAAGMPGWIEVGKTPLDPKNLTVDMTKVKKEAPLLMVVNHEPLPIISLVNKAGVKECTLLGTGPFQVGSDVLCSIYSGSSLKAKNVKLNVEEFSPKMQKAVCRIVEMDDRARKIMQNYAD